MEKIEGGGDEPKIMVLMEFLSKDTAFSFHDDPDYKPYLDAHLAGSSRNIYLFADEDIAAGFIRRGLMVAHWLCLPGTCPGHSIVPLLRRIPP